MKALVLCGALVAAIPATAAEPVVSVWYRGNPAGTPQASDLSVIRALGFNGVTWPKASATGAAELQRLAEKAGLRVEIVDRPSPATSESALKPGERIDIAVTGDALASLSAIVW